MKRKKISTYAVFISCVLLSVILGAYIGYSASPSTSIWIDSGIYPCSRTYTIFLDGSTYFAKNLYGRIETSDTNFTAVVEYASDNCDVEGGSLFFQTGTYTFSVGLLINRTGITLEGENWGSVIFNYTGSGVALTIGDASQETYHNTIKEIRFYLQSGTSTGIKLTRTFRWTLYHVRVQAAGVNPTTTGLLTDEGSGAWCGQGLIDACYFEYNQIGLNFSGRNSEINVRSTIIRGYGKTYAGGFGVWGVGSPTGASDTLKLYNTHFEYVETGIFLGSVTYSHWDNFISHCRLEQLTTGFNITSDTNIVRDSSLSGITDPVDESNLGAGNRFYNVYGYRTQFFGTDASVASGDWFAHLLAGTPDYVIITVKSDVHVWLADKNSTHFQVGVNTGSVSIDWFAEYFP